MNRLITSMRYLTCISLERAKSESGSREGFGAAGVLIPYLQNNIVRHPRHVYEVQREVGIIVVRETESRVFFKRSA